LYKIFTNLSFRIGGGLGYKIPTIFTEEAERLTYQNILPILPEVTEAEKSTGGNLDINYRISLGEFFFTINQMLFYTQLLNSLVLSEAGGNLRLTNADGPINSRGAETNIKLSYADFNLFFNYTFINAQLNYDNIDKQKPLTPRHNAGLTLMYENEDWRIGYELYYIGEQFRSDYSRTTDYWMMGLMALRTFRNFSIFINFENFTDTRQSRFQSMVFPPHNDPTFTEIWAPTDGFVANAGIKVDILGRR
jgi:iron complex outermembrane receptor protein